MRGRYFNTLAMAITAVFVLTACPGEDRPDDRPPADPDRPPVEQPIDVDLPEGVTQEDYQEGRRLFTAEGGCHACHGPQATGTGLAPDMTDGNWINVDEPTMDEVMRVIREGVPQPVQYPAPMPPMGGARLTDDQIHALAAYILAINTN